jgi:cell surface protein SprA
MKVLSKYLTKLLLFLFFTFCGLAGYTQNANDSLPFPNSFQLKDPPDINKEVEYNPTANEYEIKEKIGDTEAGRPKQQSFEEYVKERSEQEKKDYWKKRIQADGYNKKKPEIPGLQVDSKILDGIFGGSAVEIKPSGSAELIFGYNVSSSENPNLPVNQRSIGSFDFREKIQMNLTGKIGDNLELGVKYNTEASFDFDNRMNLEYEGKEDDIIKKIEAGNVSMPLTGTLIQGSQSLFGIKTKLQFGKLTVTSVASQQRGETKTIEVEGGALVKKFEIKADNYEANRHFFLSQYFRDNYDQSLSTLPLISSPIVITKVEVWITNRTNATENTRNIVAFQDLGEEKTIYNSFSTGFNNPTPDNSANNLYSNIVTNFAGVRQVNSINTTLAPTPLTETIDYDKLENATQLSNSQYTFHPQLGYISLRQTLNSNEILAVAFQYTFQGKTYQVGEFSDGGITAPQTLVLKLLKSSNINTNVPIWDLMMKNIYSIGAYQVNAQDFSLNVLYNDDQTGTKLNFIPEDKLKGTPLITYLNLDNLNIQKDPYPDGLFDFISDVTINPSNGRVIFPVLEPFGSNLQAVFDNNGISSLASKYVFNALYDSTKSEAQQIPLFNKFFLAGEYKSSVSSEIPLNAFNIPKGAVQVTAGGRPLVENVDFTVDYSIGRVKIINEGILNSGTPIKINLESNSLFSIQSKTLLGSHFDYKAAKDLNFGATVMRLSERPLTQKVNLGNEPIANTIWGVDGNYKTESRFLTKMVDKLPFFDTKKPSTVTVTGEFAHLIPGNSKAIDGENGEGVAYVDDFEGSESPIDIRSFTRWNLASTPQNQSNLFPEGGRTNDLSYGYNRSKLSWYVIDPLFYRDNSVTPPHIVNDKNSQSNHNTRQVLEQEIFPNRQIANGQTSIVSVLNMTFDPTLRGPYNYTYEGLRADGTMKNPENSWAGIMRNLETTNFQEANIEFIEFWMMDPFWDNPNHSGGDLYFNLGNISEDILKDSYKTFENGLPTVPTPVTDDTISVWGRIPVNQNIVNAFDNDPTSRVFQDVGLDGLRDVDEQAFFKNYIDTLGKIHGTTSQAYLNAVADPSADNYHYFRGSDYDIQQTSILDRYNDFNGLDGNSVSTENSPESYPTSATTTPDAEDINRDNTLNEQESYYQYKVELQPTKMNIGENYITDIRTADVQLANGTNSSIKWYQFRIPISQPESTIGNINDFRSIRFMRMFYKGFSQKIVTRFARLELVRAEWRKYTESLLSPGEYVPDDRFTSSDFSVGTVNIEENGNRSPVNYVIPPEIVREQDVSSTSIRQLNEQALSLKVCNLKDGDARAAYKNTSFDIRTYKKLKMFVHAEEVLNQSSLKDNEMTAFIRLGSDFDNNYYEYEIPLKLTPHGMYDSNIDAQQEQVWPTANRLDFSFDDLINVKRARNRQGVSRTELFQDINATRTITVVGSPNLANVQTIMVGVRNPAKKATNPWPDDGLDKCVEVWFNELRLADFDNPGGWAANMFVTNQLADFATINLAGAISKAGFGGIEQKVSERSRENILSYDVSASLDASKLLPKKVKLEIPVYAGISEKFADPEFDPLNPDVKLNQSLDDVGSRAEKDSITERVQDYTKIKSINLTGVKKIRAPNKKPRVYDIENISLNYAYTERFHRDFNTEFDVNKTYKGGISYKYSSKPKPVKPFNRMEALQKKKYLRLVRDFNFNYLPKQISVITDLNRLYQTRKLRNNTEYSLEIPQTENKSFYFNRTYNYKQDITQNLNFDFTATNNARIDEPDFVLTDQNRSRYKDSIWNNLQNFGRNTGYNHNLNLKYKVPFDKMPITNWISSNINYTGNYSWVAGPLARDSGIDSTLGDVGHTISNKQNLQVNTRLNMTRFYNKIGYLKKINNKYNTNRTTRVQNEKLKKQRDSTYNEPIAGTFMESLARIVMSVKSVSVNYTDNGGIVMPKFKSRNSLLGMASSFKEPGWAFVAGSQYTAFGKDLSDLKQKAVSEKWLTGDSLIQTPFTQTWKRTFNVNATAEPIKKLKVTLTATRSQSSNYSEYFYGLQEQLTNPRTPITNGNFSMSYYSLGSAFGSLDGNFNNAAFIKFDENRANIAKEFASIDKGGNLENYTETQQDVMLFSFLEAYGGKRPKKITNPFPKLPALNWRATYDGLGQMKSVKKYFSRVVLSHSYKSTLSYGNFSSNLLFVERTFGSEFTDSINSAGNYYSKWDIRQVEIKETFSPLIKVDMTLKNSMTARFEIKKSRTVALDFTNSQMTEILNDELIIGAGYRFKNVPFLFKLPGAKNRVKSDLNLKADLSIRDNKTIIRRIEEKVNQATAGAKIVTIKITGDYVLTKRLNLRFFYDHIINTPVISSSFPSSNINSGISVRFTL